MGRYQPGGPRGGNAPGHVADASHTGGGKSGPSHSDAGDPPALSQEAQTMARLRQKCISHPMQQCQLAVYVPPHTVGAIIGRGGRTILHVQKESMRRSGGHVGPVRISVLGSNSSNHHEGADHPGEPFQASGAQSSTWNYGAYPPQQTHAQEDTAADGPAEEDDWTPVIIRGDPVGCFAAVRQLLPLVDYDHDPDVVFEAPIHRAKHNALVGKGGVVIASLSAKYETRIMIPPNEFMRNVQGGENAWTQNAGSAMLFGDGGAGAGGPGAAGAGHAMMGTNHAAPGTMPQNANIIQLEGEIDNVEGCLVKMLSIVSGAKWTPLGVIVETNNADVERSGKKNEKSPKSDGAASNNKGPDKDETYAEATIVKIWTPSSKLLNLGKIRKVQRKTNTVIRRKKLRLGDKANDGGAGAVISEEKEEEVVDEGADETNDDNEEEETVPKDDGARTATKYIITGTTTGVKLAAAQFEKILGLEPGAATIVDATAKAKARMAASASRKEAAEPAVEGEAEGGGGGPGKKARRKKRGGNRNKPPKGARDGPSPAPQSVLDS